MAETLIPYTYADRATANSYVTLAEFNAYLANRINAPTFADDNAKTIALIEATRRLDAEYFWSLSGLSDHALKTLKDAVDKAMVDRSV